MNTEDDGDATNNLFFDLPMGLIGCSTVNNTEFPVTTAFVFDNNTHGNSNNKDHYWKGALKSNATSVTASPCTSSSSELIQGSESSSNSLRHVRFSNSSPWLYPISPTSSIMPRLRKSRDDLNAFLEPLKKFKEGSVVGTSQGVTADRSSKDLLHNSPCSASVSNMNSFVIQPAAGESSSHNPS